MDERFVTAIVPCLNEEQHIAKCLDSIIANDYPKEQLEVLVVDGGSSDKTREIMKQIEDLEFNYRLRKAGGKIMLFPDIRAQYYPSSTTLSSFFLHNFDDGIWATYPLKYGFRVSLRHIIPLLFVLTVFISFWLYIWVSLIFSAQVAAEQKDWRLAFVMPLAFGARHIGYGVGSIIGLFKLLG